MQCPVIYNMNGSKKLQKFPGGTIEMKGGSKYERVAKGLSNDISYEEIGKSQNIASLKEGLKGCLRIYLHGTASHCESVDKRLSNAISQKRVGKFRKVPQGVKLGQGVREVPNIKQFSRGCPLLYYTVAEQCVRWIIICKSANMLSIVISNERVRKKKQICYSDIANCGGAGPWYKIVLKGLPIIYHMSWSEKLTHNPREDYEHPPVALQVTLKL